MLNGNNVVYECTGATDPKLRYTDYENSTYTVVSKMAFLLGVEKRHFENEHEPPKMAWYEKLHADKTPALSVISIPREQCWSEIMRSSTNTL